MLRRANSRALAAIVIAGFAVTGLMACPAEDTQEQTETAYLDIDISPKTLPADGTTADVSIIATNADGTLGEGSVTLQATAGVLDQTTLTLANGRATAKYSCNAAEDSNCLGAQKVTAKWNDVTGGVRVTLVSETADAGVPDAGEPDAGEPDAGEPDAGVVDAGSADVAMEMKTSRDRLFVAAGDYAEITVTLSQGGGPLAAERIGFVASRGGLAATSTGTRSGTLEATTDAAGVAKVYFFEAGTIGTAQITATHLPAEGTEPSGAEAKVVLEIVRVRQLSWSTTTCGGEECTIMGIKGSGFNEQAQVGFQLVDSTGKPVEGITVSFSVADPPFGTTVSGDGITDANGLVTANVSAGSQIGVFAVKAVAVNGEVEASSPSIGIRGAKASNHGFSLYCSAVNHTVLGTTANWDPLAVEVPCKLKIVDRYNNPVGTMATPVQFKVEAGSIPNAVTTTPYAPGGANNEEGTAAITFSTMGGTTEPVDVDALPESTGQWPFPRAAEPSYYDGALVRNPRDGLVTVLAYVRGEEYFQDDNTNGIHDATERFIDQGEPFVDSNDNGTWDAGEIYIDVAPANGFWDPPNGTRDADTTIWTETRILYTSRPDPRNSFLSLNPPTATTTFGQVTRGSMIPIYAYFGDVNMNRVQEGTALDIGHTADRGEVSWESGPTLLDSYGFGIERRLISASDSAACTPTTRVCRWKLLFYDWSKGYSGYGLIKGDEPLDPASTETPPPPASDTVRVSAEVRSQKLIISIGGSIQ